jgi:FAD/FMN-containing dehydrogenase
VPLDKVSAFLERVEPAVEAALPGSRRLWVCHLGDGNVHYSVHHARMDASLKEMLTEIIEDAVAALGGSFSAEHGIGTLKRATMARRKDPVALGMMRAIKNALDPAGLMNPGKVLPDR